MRKMVSIEKSNDGTFQIKNELGHVTVGLKTPGGEEGLTPLELISSSLGLCVALTLNQLIERDELNVDELKIDVQAEKATDRPSRVARFHVEIAFSGDFDEKVKAKLIKMANRACTIGNTISNGAEIAVNVVD